MPLTQAISYAWIHRWLAKYAEAGMMDLAHDIRIEEQAALEIALKRLEAAGVESDPAVDCMAYLGSLRST